MTVTLFRLSQRLAVRLLGLFPDILDRSIPPTCLESWILRTNSRRRDLPWPRRFARLGVAL